MLSPFVEHSPEIMDKITQKGQKVVYQHQAEAAVAISQYFKGTTSRTGLVVLPTGCGKSGVAVLAAYAVARPRVLVITPSEQISHQLAQDFSQSEANFLVQRGLVDKARIKEFAPNPIIFRSSQKRQQKKKPPKGWITLTNPHKLGENTKTKLRDFHPAEYDLILLDEAHHFPATTWKKVVDYFTCSKLFLTATPFNKGRFILPNMLEQVVYDQERRTMVLGRIIRPVAFHEVSASQAAKQARELKKLGNWSKKDLQPENLRASLVGIKIKALLDDHDKQDSGVVHQAMILVLKKVEADECARVLNWIFDKHQRHSGGRAENHKNTSGSCFAAAYHSGTPESVKKAFDKEKIRVLVVCGRLLEGYDNKNISVVGLLRNVGSGSRTLFTQFVGRCVRRVHSKDSVHAAVVSHSYHNQRENFQDLISWSLPQKQEEIQKQKSQESSSEAGGDLKTTKRKKQKNKKTKKQKNDQKK